MCARLAVGKPFKLPKYFLQKFEDSSIHIHQVYTTKADLQWMSQGALQSYTS